MLLYSLLGILTLLSPLADAQDAGQVPVLPKVEPAKQSATNLQLELARYYRSPCRVANGLNPLAPKFFLTHYGYDFVPKIADRLWSVARSRLWRSSKQTASPPLVSGAAVERSMESASEQAGARVSELYRALAAQIATQLQAIQDDPRAQQAARDFDEALRNRFHDTCLLTAYALDDKEGYQFLKKNIEILHELERNLGAYQAAVQSAREAFDNATVGQVLRLQTNLAERFLSESRAKLAQNLGEVTQFRNRFAELMQKNDRRIQEENRQLIENERMAASLRERPVRFAGGRRVTAAEQKELRNLFAEKELRILHAIDSLARDIQSMLSAMRSPR